LRWPETPKLRIDGSAPNDSDVNPKKKKKMSSISYGWPTTQCLRVGSTRR